MYNKTVSSSALKNFFAILLAAALYFVLSYVRIPILEKDASFFVDWLVVFLHEFGHALAAELTGGDATQLVIFPNIPGVAGYACTAGGIRPIVQMGGYIGSAIFGAFFIFAALHRNRIFSQYGLRIIAIMLVLSQVLWFPSGACGEFRAGLRDTMVSLSFCFAGAFLFWKLNSLPFGLKKSLLLFLGTSSLCQIILDINGGPSSDLEHFTQSMSIAGFTLIPLFVWKVIWFIIVVLIALLTIKLACRGENENPPQN